MGKALYKILHYTIKGLEVCIALLLIVSLCVYCFKIFLNVTDYIAHGIDSVAFNTLLTNIITLVIGIEFVKMIVHPTTNTVVEVLMFTIARILIIDHSSSMVILLGVVAVAVLFGTRKFLFCDLESEN